MLVDYFHEVYFWKLSSEKSLKNQMFFFFILDLNILVTAFNTKHRLELKKIIKLKTQTKKKVLYLQINFISFNFEIQFNEKVKKIVLF